MSKLTFIAPTFNCKLRCGQCQSRKIDGVRCRNRVCHGFPDCWMHNKKGHNVKTRLSPHHGKGLFATANIARNQWICPYNGEQITKRCLNLRYPGDVTAPYAVTHGGGTYDGACSRGIGCYANTKTGANGNIASAQSHNAKLGNRRGRGIWLYATRNIPAGQEIFCWYGNGYRFDLQHQTKRSKVLDNRPC